ncbi:MAG: hypothetical protein PHD60_07810 [Clostridia bacterium]|nr:hypothetical protein [Clostridia bacterium]
MLSKKMMGKVVSVVLTGGLILSCGATVQASDNVNANFKSFTGIRQMINLRGQGLGNGLDNHFDQLVEKEIISQEQADKWAEYCEENREERQEERKAELEKVKAMTAEECKVYMAELKESRSDSLSEIVEAGVITQEQADEIAELRSENPMRSGMSKISNRNSSDERGQRLGKMGGQKGRGQMMGLGNGSASVN